MKVAIMQPYFIPYIGYWQLMNLVDKYVVYDDVNFINRGWINRNRILVNGNESYFNIPLIGASQNKLINQISVNNNESLIKKNLRTLEYAYKKAPYFKSIFPLAEKILCCQEQNLADYIMNSFHVLCEYLNIHTELFLSSSLEKNCNLKGEEKILSINKLLGATEYYNAIGGQSLYSKEIFKKEGIQLSFLKTEEIIYKQFDNEFCPCLSIIDVMMFNSQEQILEFLQKYTLI